MGEQLIESIYSSCEFITIVEFDDECWNIAYASWYDPILFVNMGEVYTVNEFDRAEGTRGTIKYPIQHRSGYTIK